MVLNIGSSPAGTHGHGVPNYFCGGQCRAQYPYFHIACAPVWLHAFPYAAKILFPASRFKSLRYNLLPFVTDNIVAFPEKLFKAIVLEVLFLA